MNIAEILAAHFPQQDDWGDIECACDYRVTFTRNWGALEEYPYDSPEYEQHAYAHVRAWAAHVRHAIEGESGKI